MEKKFYANSNMKITNQEMDIFIKLVRQKYYKKEKLTNLEYCVNIANDEDALDNFLFHSTDDEFLRILKIFKKFIPKENLNDLPQLIARKVPTRFNRIGGRILDVLFESTLSTKSNSDIRSAILRKK